MKNKEIVSQSRRKALLGSAAGATALTVWQKPAIKSVLLPAHAEMSVGQEPEPVEPEPVEELEIFTLSGTADSLFQDVERIQQSIIEAYPEASAMYSLKNSGALVKASSLPQKVFDFVIPKALAQSSSEDLVSFYLANNGDGTFKFQWYSSETFEDCLLENLFYVDSVAIGDTEAMEGFNCVFGIAVTGAIDMTLVSVAEDLSSAVVDVDGSEIELLFDSAGEEFDMPATCPCYFDIDDGGGDVRAS